MNIAMLTINSYWMWPYALLFITGGQQGLWLPAAAATATGDATTTTTNDTVLLGGLFAVHSNEGGVCGKINAGPLIDVQAMVFAVDSINRDPNLLPNVTLAYNIRDTCGINNVALEETVEMMELGGDNSDPLAVGISGLVGPAQSDISMSVASLLRIFEVPQISHASTSVALNDQQRFDYFFRTIPPDNFQARAMADLIVQYEWTYVIGIHTDDTYGRGGIGALKEELSERNDTRYACVLDAGDTTALPLNAEDTHYENLVSYMNQVWIRNATVAVLFGQQQVAIRFLRYIQDHNSSLDHLTFIASDAWTTQVPEIYHPVAMGMLGVVQRILNIESFDRHLQSLKPTPRPNPSPSPSPSPSSRPTGGSPNEWLLEYWDDTYNCTNDGSNHTDSCKVSAQRLTGAKNRVAYVVDAVYAFAHAIDKMLSATCPNSTGLCNAVTVKRFSHKALNGTKLREFLYNVSFTSLSMETFKFGDQHVFYDIFNLRRSGGTVKVGTWNTQSVPSLDIADSIEWRDGSSVPPLSVCSVPCRPGEEPVLVQDQSDCCHTCSPCGNSRSVSTGEKCVLCMEGMSPNIAGGNDVCVNNTVTFLRWSSPWAVLILLGSILGLSATGFVSVVFIVFNKHKIVKATSRELSAILLTGVALCYILPVSFIAEPSPVSCGVRRFSLGFCFSLCFSPLLMKTNRIYRVFHTAPHTPRFADSRSQVVFTCILILVQVLIGALWLGLERPGDTLLHNGEITEKVCTGSPYVGLPISLLYSLFLLTLTTFYAFLSREIPANFNEAKFIGITLYSVCVVWLGFIPTYFATIKLGTVYQTSTLMFAVLLSASTTLACLFFPKVILLFMKLSKKSNIEEEKPSMYTTDLELRTLGSSTFSLKSQDLAST